jgi:hypothetical protein
VGGGSHALFLKIASIYVELLIFIYFK